MIVLVEHYAFPSEFGLLQSCGDLQELLHGTLRYDDS